MRCSIAEKTTVGHDLGRLVLRLQRRLDAAPDLVREALGQFGRRQGTGLDRRVCAEVERRWDVEPLGGDVLVELTVLIPAEDLDAAVAVGVADHLRFVNLLSRFDGDEPEHHLDPCGWSELARAYAARFAAALADTD